MTAGVKRTQRSGPCSRTSPGHVPTSWEHACPLTQTSWILVHSLSSGHCTVAGMGHTNSLLCRQHCGEQRTCQDSGVSAPDPCTPPSSFWASICLIGRQNPKYQCGVGEQSCQIPGGVWDSGDTQCSPPPRPYVLLCHTAQNHRPNSEHTGWLGTR